MNFPMNRWYGWVGEEGRLDEMRLVVPRVASYADWKREFLALAEEALHPGHALRAGFYDQIEHHTIPYADGRVEGLLPAYRIMPPQSKGTLVFFGGFDSYIEELTTPVCR